MQAWILYALAAAFCAALVSIFGKIGMSGLDSTLATTIRAIIMALFLLGISISYKKFDMLTQFNTKASIFIVLAGLAGASSWLFYFKALQLGTVTGVVVLDKLSVVMAVILAFLVLGEPLTVYTIAGLILLTAGTLLIAVR